MILNRPRGTNQNTCLHLLTPGVILKFEFVVNWSRLGLCGRAVTARLVLIVVFGGACVFVVVLEALFRCLFLFITTCCSSFILIWFRFVLLCALFICFFVFFIYFILTHSTALKLLRAVLLHSHTLTLFHSRTCAPHTRSYALTVSHFHILTIPQSHTLTLSHL